MTRHQREALHVATAAAVAYLASPYDQVAVRRSDLCDALTALRDALGVTPSDARRRREQHLSRRPREARR